MPPRPLLSRIVAVALAALSPGTAAAAVLELPPARATTLYGAIESPAFVWSDPHPVRIRSADPRVRVRTGANPLWLAEQILRPGDQARLRVALDGDGARLQTATVAIGAHTLRWRILLPEVDRVPDPIAIPPWLDAAPGQPVASQPVTLSGFVGTLRVRAAPTLEGDAWFSIDGGRSWSPEVEVTPGTAVAVGATASTVPGRARTVPVEILAGDQVVQTTRFAIVTAAEPIAP